MKTTRLGSQPYFLHGFLAVNDDFAAILTRQREYVATTLAVNIEFVGQIFHRPFNGLQGGFGLSQKFAGRHGILVS